MPETMMERKKPGPKPRLPKVSVMERRLKHPFGSPSVPITLVTPGHWAIRVVNSTMRPGRIHDMTQNKGWVFVLPEELDGTPDELGFKAVENRLIRGEHGEEVLMKMPQRDYDLIHRAKEALNLKGLGKSALRESVAQDTAKAYGSEAGETVYDAMKHTTIDATRSPVELDE